MNKIVTIIAPLVIAITAMAYSGCSKDRVEPEEEKKLNEYNSANDYLDSKKEEEQEFEVDTPGTGPITGKKGTNLWVPKECLMFPNGDSVDWPFTVKLVELYSAKDMIYYQLPTVAGGNIMETEGEIRVRAFKDGTELLIRPNCSIEIEMPNSAPKNYMRVFYGFDSGSITDWTDDPSTLGVSTTLNPVFSVIPSGYRASIAKLGWINCGFTVGTGTGHQLSFTSTTDILQNVSIFAYFPSHKGLMQVYNLTSGVIPSGSDVKLVGMAIDASGNLFSFDGTLNVTSNVSVTVTMQAISDPDLTALLDAL